MESLLIILVIGALLALVYRGVMTWIARALVEEGRSPQQREQLEEVDKSKSAQNEGKREIEKLLASGSISDEKAIEYVSRDGCGNLLEFLPESLRDDRRVVSAAIAQPIPGTVYYYHGMGAHTIEPVASPLEYASIKCRDDRELVLKAISFSANAYKHASQGLRSDPDIYLAAARAEVVQSNCWGDSYVDCYTAVSNKLGKPSLNDSFLSDAVGLYEFVVGLERLIDYEYDAGEFAALFSEKLEDWHHAGDLYDEHFPVMFQDWEVVCRVLGCMATTDDPLPSFFEMYKAKWSERYETYAPDNLYQDENGVKTDQITNRAFVLYALKAGHTHVMNWVTDAMKNDPEVSKLLNVDSG